MFNQSSKFWIDYINQNEINSTPRTKIGQRDLLYKNIYNSFSFFSGYDPSSSNINFIIKNRHRKNHGPIYDMTFSKDGKLLIAGTEENALLIFDSLNHQLINQLDDAHENSINFIKFLDQNIFATCSNDTKIALWDRRNFNHKLRVLADGHSYFVKNLEYDPNLKLLISSAFDGFVNLWDINNSSDQLEPGFVRTRPQDCPYKKVLSLNCLMRMRMTNDHTKMIISSAEGYIMVIHDLDLFTLKEDLYEFQSDLYRLMQKKHNSCFDFGSWQNSLFKNTKNRVELISDFPSDNEAHLIGSLDVHPQNWCILSRNSSRDENSEFTCIHNIQDYEQPNEMMDIELPRKDNMYFSHSMFKTNLHRSNANNEQTDSRESNRIAQEIENSTNGIQSTAENNQFNLNNQNDQDISMESNPNDLHISPLIIISARSSRRAHATVLNPTTSYRQIKPGNKSKIFCNLDRMTHYLEESNVYRMFFKEAHFSSCGRFIASPHSNGFRLLSFNPECTEMCDEILKSSFKKPQQLNEIKAYSDHSNFVTTVHFSPIHHLIASGDLNGLVNWYQPVL